MKRIDSIDNKFFEELDDWTKLRDLKCKIDELIEAHNSQLEGEGVDYSLAFKIAQEAHMMGRIYHSLGEKEKPHEVIEQLEKMVNTFIKNHKRGGV